MSSLLALALGLAATPAAGHTMQPALLQLTERDSGTQVSWTVARIAGRVPEVSPILPEHCAPIVPPAVQSDAKARRSRWTVDCGAAGLAGQEVRFDRKDADGLDVVVRWSRPEAPDAHLVVHPGDAGVRLPEDDADTDLPVASYLPSGLSHILEGWDHLAFVLGLVLVVRRKTGSLAAGPLFKAVTGFTVGHSLTLAPAALGLVSGPSGATEACIALSILYLATELARPTQVLNTGLLFRHPTLIAGACGLLHGLGFAGALAEVGLPQSAVATALGLFNVGVELGQLAFVAVLVGLLALATRLSLDTHLRRGAVWLLGITGAFWSIERALSIVLP